MKKPNILFPQANRPELSLCCAQHELSSGSLALCLHRREGRRRRLPALRANHRHGKLVLPGKYTRAEVEAAGRKSEVALSRQGETSTAIDLVTGMLAGGRAVIQFKP